MLSLKIITILPIKNMLELIDLKTKKIYYFRPNYKKSVKQDFIIGQIIKLKKA